MVGLSDLLTLSKGVAYPFMDLHSEPSKLDHPAPAIGVRGLLQDHARPGQYPYLALLGLFVMGLPLMYGPFYAYSDR